MIRLELSFIDWVGMDVLREERFALSWHSELVDVSVIKAMGAWMQRLGLTRAHRSGLELVRLLMHNAAPNSDFLSLPLARRG